ncbi:hypothetical protein I317_06995 [Kwoniella heveanensis CBS 569]|nr:hypothetical protein I317_06995 [Kwoniella heveanensis CBS 569]
MCPGHDHEYGESEHQLGTSASTPTSRPKCSNAKAKTKGKGKTESGPNDGSTSEEVCIPPPDWEQLALPPDHVLSHLTDAHCHPTDLKHQPSVYDNVKLGGLASMATIVGDQDKVRDLSIERWWYRDTSGNGRPSSDSDGPSENGTHVSARSKRGKDGKGVGVVACYGYHPWFTHLYTLSPPDSIPSKDEHYHALFSPSSPKQKDLLKTLLPYLPDPIPFAPLLDNLREDIRRSLGEGRLTMLGEVGLDGSAKMRWPKAARHLHPDHIDLSSDAAPSKNGEEEEWKRLTPFKVPMAHQRAILDLQMDVAVELGVNISFHSVACAGPSLDALTAMRDRHGGRFTNRVNVDLHSAGGWSGPFWSQAEKNLLNLYASPSIFITGRSPTASSLIQSISTDRILVESDSHDVRLSDRVVWAAAVWISRIKGWNLEGRDREGAEEGNRERDAISKKNGDQDTPKGEDKHQEETAPVRVPEWTLKDELRKEEQAEKQGLNVDSKGRIKSKSPDEIWTVRTLERNWARFMRLIDD